MSLSDIKIVISYILLSTHKKTHTKDSRPIPFLNAATHGKINKNKIMANQLQNLKNEILAEIEEDIPKLVKYSNIFNFLGQKFFGSFVRMKSVTNGLTGIIYLIGTIFID